MTFSKRCLRAKLLGFMVGIWVCFENLSCTLFSLCVPLFQIYSAYPHESGELHFDPTAGASNLHAQPLLGSESWLHKSGLWHLDFNSVAPAYILFSIQGRLFFNYMNDFFAEAVGD